MSLPTQPLSQEFAMEDVASVQESVATSNMSITEPENVSNLDSYVSGHTSWLDDYPPHLSKEIDLLRFLWENFPVMHDDLDRLGRQILLGHEKRDELLKGHVKRENQLDRKLERMEFALTNARTQVWAYKVELDGMGRKIFELEATLDNVQEESIHHFNLEVRIEDLEERLDESTASNERFQINIKTLKKAKNDLMRTCKGLRQEVKQERDLKTDFEDRYNELVAGQGNVERWLAEYKIRNMKAAWAAAKAETAHWKQVAADVINGRRPSGSFRIFSTNRGLTRRQSF